MDAATRQFLNAADRTAEDRYYDHLAELFAGRIEAEFQLTAAQADAMERGRIPVTYEPETTHIVPVRRSSVPGILFDVNPKPI